MIKEEMSSAFPPDGERIEREVKYAIAKYPKANMNFIIAEVMKATKSTANPTIIEQAFRKIAGK
jgi:Asp-tRNA(Asn)/Glu-tRNA(Gln) amidotransferase B subunit